VILQVLGLEGGSSVRLAGPGIKGERIIAPRGLPADFWDQVAENGAAFQFGVDILLVAEEGLIGLPRTVRIQS
jgi:alpha-D-ribose 1-methylphosphonate 5-triphosphate synthase subunit PhnH